MRDFGVSPCQKVEIMEHGNTRILVRTAASGLALAAALGICGCRVHVDKDANGKEKNVQVDTPFGGVHVNTDQISASDLGLPVYPGAEQMRDSDNDKSADVHLGFGDWQIRVKAVNYSTPDSRQKVIEFYKKALSRFGDVITCNGHSAVGTPAVTHEGLSCEEDEKGDGNGKVKFDSKDFNQDFELKAGSKRHQHIVGFKDPKDGKTRFALVAIDLPASIANGDNSKE
jgi:hypothetical protein